MYFYYKNKYENKSKNNEYLPKNFDLTNFKKKIIKNFWLVLSRGYDGKMFIFIKI